MCVFTKNDFKIRNETTYTHRHAHAKSAIISTFLFYFFFYVVVSMLMRLRVQIKKDRNCLIIEPISDLTAFFNNM